MPTRSPFPPGGNVVDRHVDSGAVLASFADEVLVRCIHCGAVGRVSASWEPYRWVGSFVCTDCELTLTTDARDWVGPVIVSGKRPCGRCGHKWLSVREHAEGLSSAIPTELPATCPACGHTSQVAVKTSRNAPSDHPIDPHFGLPLLLAVQCRHGLIWAYNERHLRELQSYVGAVLRTRQRGPGQSMFSRLPVWMKLAKNREYILKTLNKLEAILPEMPE